MEALTPNHILLLKGKPILSPGLFENSDLYMEASAVRCGAFLEKVDIRVFACNARKKKMDMAKKKLNSRRYCCNR